MVLGNGLHLVRARPSVLVGWRDVKLSQAE